MLLLLLACAQPQETDDSTSSFCADAPVVDYNNFGRGFMTESCQGCHASTTPDRQGAPESVVFDSVEEVWRWDERILARAGSEQPDMPPQGGVEADDRSRLRWWLLCADPGS